MVFMSNFKVIVTFISLSPAKQWVLRFTTCAVSLVLVLMFTFISGATVLHTRSGRNFCGSKNRCVNGPKSNRRDKRNLVLIQALLDVFIFPQDWINLRRHANISHLGLMIRLLFVLSKSQSRLRSLQCLIAFVQILVFILAVHQIQNLRKFQILRLPKIQILKLAVFVPIVSL